MSDILTQIQDELDMLLHQMSAALAYIKDNAPPAPIPGQPTQSTFAEHEAQSRAQDPGAPQNHSLTQHTTQASQSQLTIQTTTQPGTQTQTQTQATTQDSGAVGATQASGTTTHPPFHPSIKELSYDLIMKEQQIEVLINRLPGIGTSEQDQVARMRALERELEGIEGERQEAVREKEELVRRVERGLGVVGGM